MPVDFESGCKDQEVELEHTFWCVDLQDIVVAANLVNRTADMEAGIVMARNAQGAALGWRYLLLIDVVADTPFPLVGQAGIAMHQPRVAGPLSFVDPRYVVAPDDQIDAGSPRFQCCCRAVHGRRARSDHADTQARKAGVVVRVR